MRKTNGLASDSAKRCERAISEGPSERREVGRVLGKRLDLVDVAMDRNLQADERRDPAWREVVGIEMGKANRGDVIRLDAGASHAPCECVRPNAGVNQNNTGRRPKKRCVSRGAAGENAQF